MLSRENRDNKPQSREEPGRETTAKPRVLSSHLRRSFSRLRRFTRARKIRSLNRQATQATIRETHSPSLTEKRSNHSSIFLVKFEKIKASRYVISVDIVLCFVNTVRPL